MFAIPDRQFQIAELSIGKVDIIRDPTRDLVENIEQVGKISVSRRESLSIA